MLCEYVYLYLHSIPTYNIYLTCFWGRALLYRRVILYRANTVPTVFTVLFSHMH